MWLSLAAGLLAICQCPCTAPCSALCRYRRDVQPAALCCAVQAGFGSDIGAEKFMNIKCRYRWVPACSPSRSPARPPTRLSCPHARLRACLFDPTYSNAFVICARLSSPPPPDILPL